MTARKLAASLLCTLLFSGVALAADPVPQQDLPAWDQLSQAQRDTLVAPLRERWDNAPEDRSRMYRRAERWQAMPAEQRTRARRGMKRWEHMDPARRAQMHALFERTRDMPRAQRKEAMLLFKAMLDMTPEQRETLRQGWPRMTAEERAQWMQEHAPRHKGHGRRGHSRGE